MILKIVGRANIFVITNTISYFKKNFIFKMSRAAKCFPATKDMNFTTWHNVHVISTNLFGTILFLSTSNPLNAFISLSQKQKSSLYSMYLSHNKQLKQPLDILFRIIFISNMTYILVQGSCYR